MAHNVLGGELQACSTNPQTGFFRNGKCDTNAKDIGMHTVCAVMTEEFLAFSREHGNDLSRPMPEHRFPGLTRILHQRKSVSFVTCYNAGSYHRKNKGKRYGRMYTDSLPVSIL